MQMRDDVIRKSIPAQSDMSQQEVFYLKKLELKVQSLKQENADLKARHEFWYRATKIHQDMRAMAELQQKEAEEKVSRMKDLMEILNSNETELQIQINELQSKLQVAQQESSITMEPQRSSIMKSTLPALYTVEQQYALQTHCESLQIKLERVTSQLEDSEESKGMVLSKVGYRDETLREANMTIRDLKRQIIALNETIEKRNQRIEKFRSALSAWYQEFVQSGETDQASLISKTTGMSELRDDYNQSPSQEEADIKTFMDNLAKVEGASEAGGKAIEKPSNSSILFKPFNVPTLVQLFEDH
jgi:chromosome segregation ATPase